MPEFSPVKLLLVLCLLGSFSAFADETYKIDFAAKSPTPVFRINDFVVENSGVSLTSDVTVVLKRMELLTVAPDAVYLPDGDYLLNIGGYEAFNRTFLMKVDGRGKRVVLTGNAEAAKGFAYGAAIGTVGLIASVSSGSSIASVAFGGLTLAGVIGWAIESPRAEVRDPEN
jgi:hypothetical protein